MNIDISERNLKKNAALGLVYKPISMILSYIYVPIVLNYLGEEKFGIWATILSVLSWINYFDIGIGNGLRNKLSENLGQENSEEKCKKYISSSYMILSAIVITVMFFATIGCQYIDWNIFFGIKQFDESLRQIMFVSVLFMCFSFIMSISKSIYNATQRNHVVNLINVIQQIILLITVSLLAKISNSSLFYVALLYGMSNILVEIYFTLKLFCQNKIFIPNIRYFGSVEAKETTNLGLAFFVIQIAALILYATNNLIISHISGPSEVTSYTTVSKIFMMITTVFSVLIAPYWSAITVLKSKGQFTDIYSIRNKMLKLWGLLSLGSIILISAFKPIATLWLGRELLYPAGLIPLMAIYAIIYMWNALHSQIANGMEMMKVSVIVAILQGIINIPLALFFAVTFELKTFGVLLGTVVSMLLSAVVMPIYINSYKAKFYVNN